MKELPDTSPKKSFGFTRLTTKPDSARSSRASRVLRLAFALCALLAVMLSFSAPPAAHAAPARAAKPCPISDCDPSSLPPPPPPPEYLARCHIDATYPVTEEPNNTAHGLIGEATMFYSSSPDCGYWMKATSKAPYPIDIDFDMGLPCTEKLYGDSGPTEETEIPISHSESISVEPGATAYSDLETIQSILGSMAQYPPPKDTFHEGVPIQGTISSIDWPTGFSSQVLNSAPIPTNLPTPTPIPAS
jgi:hypothetical protein